jgi:U4/U6 small nuclear ribonucleoprotein PRP4
MMHPSRQARVEEEPEVSKRPTSAHVESSIHNANKGTPLPSSRPFHDVSATRDATLTLLVPCRMIARVSTSRTSVSHITVSPIATPNSYTAIDRNYDMPAGTADGTGAAPERASALLSQFDRKRRAAAIAVPTDDVKVRARLRELNEPITLFGEGPGDRRDRLRELLATLADDGIDDDLSMQDADEVPVDQEEEFYTEGIPDLLSARRSIAHYSLPRAAARIQRQKEDSHIPLRTHIKHRKAIKDRLAGFELFGSQIAAERPVSIARFSPNSSLLACGNWASGIKLLDVPNLNTTRTLRGHTGIVGGIDWYPNATLPTSTVSPSTVNLASGAGGQGGSPDIHLWSLEQDTPLATLSGHTDRVCRVAFHPSGQHLASASFDTTWRLWDVATTTELLLQEGHSRQVFAVSFNTDGSLLASGGFDSMGRIWDLRTGRTVMILDGHIREIYALDWGTDGHRVLSGSGDGWVKCWDIRAVKATGGLGAHSGNVSDLRWFKGIDGPGASGSSALPPSGAVDVKMGNGNENGHYEDEQRPGRDRDREPRKTGTFFVSGGFDKNVNVYSADDWALARQLSGHSGNVLSVDVSDDSRWIASSGHDRTVKLWARDDMEGI